MSNLNLTEAIELAKAGNRVEAQTLLSRITKYDSDNSIAWLWLAAVTDEPARKIKYLETAVRLDPENKTAQDALRRLVRSTAPQPSIDDIVPPASMPSSAKPLAVVYSRRARLIGSLILVFFPLLFSLPAFAVITNKSEFFGRMVLSCSARSQPADLCSQPAGWIMLTTVITLLSIAVFSVLSIEFSLQPEQIQIRKTVLILVTLFLVLPVIVILFFGPIILFMMETPGLVGR